MYLVNIHVWTDGMWNTINTTTSTFSYDKYEYERKIWTGVSWRQKIPTNDKKKQACLCRCRCQCGCPVLLPFAFYPPFSTPPHYDNDVFTLSCYDTYAIKLRALKARRCFMYQRGSIWPHRGRAAGPTNRRHLRTAWIVYDSVNAVGHRLYIEWKIAVKTRWTESNDGGSTWLMIQLGSRRAHQCHTN